MLPTTRCPQPPNCRNPRRASRSAHSSASAPACGSDPANCSNVPATSSYRPVFTCTLRPAVPVLQVSLLQVRRQIVSQMQRGEPANQRDAESRTLCVTVADNGECFSQLHGCAITLIVPISSFYRDQRDGVMSARLAIAPDCACKPNRSIVLRFVAACRVRSAQCPLTTPVFLFHYCRCVTYKARRAAPYARPAA